MFVVSAQTHDGLRDCDVAIFPIAASRQFFDDLRLGLTEKGDQMAILLLLVDLNGNFLSGSDRSSCNLRISSVSESSSSSSFSSLLLSNDRAN